MSSSHTSEFIKSIVKARITILKQLHQRGYNIDDYNYFDVNEINTLYATNQLSMLLTKQVESSEAGEASESGEIKEGVKSVAPPEKTLVHFYLQRALRPKDLTNIITDVFESGDDSLLTKNDTLLIVINDPKIESVVSELKHVWERDGYFIIVSNLAALKFNVLRHVLVPEHRILSKEEVEIQKVRSGIQHDSQWPSITRFDPVAEAIGIRPGQVCVIYRPSKTAIRAPYWRMCVNKSIEKKKTSTTKENKE